MIYIIKFFWIISVIVFLYNPPVLHLGFEFVLPIFLWLPFLTRRVINSIISVYIKLKFYFYFYWIFLIVSFVLTAFLGGDFSFLFSLIKILFTFVGVLILSNIGFSIFFNKVYVLFTPFFLQLIYIYIGLFNYKLTFPIQSYLHLNNYARFELNYLGQRGLSFSDSLAFGLVLQLGVLFIFITYFLIKDGRNFITLFLLFSFAPLMSAGRTAAVFYFLLLFINYRHLLKMSFFLFIFFFTIVLISGPTFISEFRLFEYVLSSYFDYLVTGEVSNSSLDALYNNMLYKVDLCDFLIGKAKYYNPDGTYYGSSDSGYFRFLFFFGIVISIIIYVGYFFVSLISFKKVGINWNFYVPFILLLFLLHIKGEVVNSHSLHSALFWSLSFFVLDNKRANSKLLDF